jgi:hypothetical protein
LRTIAAEGEPAGGRPGPIHPAWLALLPAAVPGWWPPLWAWLTTLDRTLSCSGTLGAGGWPGPAVATTGTYDPARLKQQHRCSSSMIVACFAGLLAAASPPPPPAAAPTPCPRPAGSNYTKQWCSVITHPMPQWFEDAKFGICGCCCDTPLLAVLFRLLNV